MLLLYLSHLASEKPKKLEKTVLLGFRQTKETRKACALGLQKPKKLEKAVLLGVRETKETRKGRGCSWALDKQRNSKPQYSWAACLGALASENTERPNKQNKDPVQRRWSKMLVEMSSLCLCTWWRCALISPAPCMYMHGFTLVYIYIYIGYR